MKNRLNIVEILLKAVFSIGGMQKSIDTEDIAQKAFKIAPENLSWKKYSDQIDLSKVKTNLYLAKKNKFLEGNEKLGWMLSKKGLNEIEKTKKKSSNGFKLRILKEDLINQEKEISRIKSNEAFINFYKFKKKPSIKQLENIFKVNVYTTEENIKKRIRTVINLCRSNENITNFLEKNKKILTKRRA